MTQERPEFFGNRRVVLNEAPQGRLSLHWVEMRRGNELEVKTTLEEKFDGSGMPTRIEYKMLWDESRRQEIIDELSQKWEHVIKKVNAIKEEVAEYIDYKTRGKGDDAAFHEALCNVMNENMDAIITGKALPYSLHESLRSALISPQTTSTFHMDKVEESLSTAAEAVARVNYKINEILSPEEGFELNDYARTVGEDARNKCAQFTSTITQILQNVDAYWWQIMRRSDKMQPVTSRDKQMIADVPKLIRQASSQYDQLMQEMEAIGRGDDMEEIHDVVSQKDKQNNLVACLNFLNSVVSRDELLRDTMEKSRSKERQK